MPNGRCRMHGGASTGPIDQRGNQNATTHGVYARLAGGELVADAELLAATPADERRRMATALLEARFLRAAADPDTPLDALTRAASKLVEHLAPSEAGDDDDGPPDRYLVVDPGA